jgi:hypothetical protein
MAGFPGLAMTRRDSWAILVGLLTLALVISIAGHTGLSSRTRRGLLLVAAGVLVLAIWRRSVL